MATPTDRPAPQLEAVLDRIPTGLILVEAETARVTFANAAAHRMAGGQFPTGAAAEDYHTVYFCTDAQGRRIPDEQMPGVRAARGERLRNFEIDWHTPDGVRSLLVSSETLPAGDGGADTVVVSFEDVSRLREAERRLRQSRDQREAILDGVADSVTAQEPSGRLVYANQAAARALGYESAEALLGAPPEEVLGRYELFDEAGEPLPAERLPGRAALRGERPEPAVVRFRDRRSGEERWSVVKSTPIRDDAGEVVLAINVIEDISEHKEAEQAQRFLAESSRILGASLDYEHTLRTVAGLAVPDLADWCAVDVRDEDGVIQHVAVAHTDPAKVAFVDELRRRYPTDPDAPAGVPKVLRTGQPEIYPDIPDALLEAVAHDEQHLGLIQRIGMRSVMILPMVARGRTVGAVTLVSAESGRRFGGRDLLVAEDLASRAATAVDNARLFRDRSHIARTLQQSLLPPQLPALPGVEVAARYRPAGEGYEVGGDFYDVFPTGHDCWGVVIGDVCGKGADAAAVTALARYTVRAAAVQQNNPASVLRLLNEALLRQQVATEDSDRFCTVAYATVAVGDSGRPRLTVASGGHPLPLLLRADGAVQEIGEAGTLLGVMSEVDLPATEVQLGPGDAVVFYTDGVPEALAPDRMLSSADLRAILGRCNDCDAPAIADWLEREALGDSDALPRDDIAILVLRVRGREEPPGGGSAESRTNASGAPATA